MSGVGFFFKSINPNPAIPIRYRLPEIVHFKAKNYYHPMSFIFLFSENGFIFSIEKHELGKRDKLPVYSSDRFALPVCGYLLPVDKIWV